MLQGLTWLPSLTSLIADGSGYQVTQNALAPKFASSASSPDLFQVTRDGYILSFALEGAANVGVSHKVNSLTKAGADEASYAAVFSHTNLQYQVTPGSVKESVILTAAPTTAPTFRWRIETGGLIPVQNGTGDLEFQTPEGAVVFVMPVPVMWDSSGTANASAPAFANVPYRLEDVTTNSAVLVLSPSMPWLTDPSRVYPVDLDPTAVAADNTHSEKADGTANTGHALVGNPNESGCNCYWRTVAHYNYEQFFGKQLIAAKLTGTYYAGATPSEPVNVYDSTINDPPTTKIWDAHGTKWGSLTVATASGNSGDIGMPFAGWINSRSSNHYIWLNGAETAGAYTYKALTTSVTFTYVSYPSVTVSSPADGATGQSLAPTLVAVGSNPTTAALTYNYLISTDPSFPAGNTWTSPDTASSTYVVPSDAGLSTSTTYYWEAEVSDEYQGVYGTDTHRFSGARSFTTGDVAPLAPTGISATPWWNADGTGDATSGLPTFSASATDPDNDDVALTFDVYDSSNALQGSCTTDPVASGGTASCALTSALPNGTYSVISKANDGTTDGSWSAPQAITVNDVATPTAPAPNDGDFVDSVPTLNVALPSGDPSGTQVQYVVGDDPTWSDTPLATSIWMAPGSYSIPTGVLASDAVYYWKVSIQVPLPGGTQTWESNTWSFDLDTNVQSDEMPATLQTIVDSAAADPNSAPIDEFDWDAATQNLAVHYSSNLSTLQSWLDPQLAGYSHTYVLDANSRAAIDAAIATLITNDGVPVSIAEPDATFASISVSLDPSYTESTSGSGGFVATSAPVGGGSPQTVPLPSSISGVPVTYSDGSGVTETAFSRLADISPFSGGAAIFNETHPGGCTSGVPVKHTSHGKTTEKMLTAFHCGKAGDLFVTGSLQPAPGNGKIIGTFADGNTGGFLSYGADIGTVTGHFNASIYVGSWKGSSLAKIKGVFTPVKGNIVCADGSYSGQVCNNKITGTDVWECETGETKNSTNCYGGMAEAVNKTDGFAIGNGDSGGPVYMPVKGGVKVGGIIAALVQGYSACNGYPAASNRHCGPDFYFSPVVRFTTDNSGWTVMTE